MDGRTRRAAEVFDQRAEEYDNWFEESQLFELELAALVELLPELPPPRLEVGVGPGRFAERLQFGHGVDPAFAPLVLARKRGVIPCQAAGEALPFAAGVFGSVALLFSLCFVSSPGEVIAECSRVLAAHGRFLVGFIPAASPWGQALAAKGAEGHPFYRYARFLTVGEVATLLEAQGFEILAARSTLFLPPGREGEERIVAGAMESAGFVALLAGRR